ncbi:MAG: alpha/beta fold hydrolase [Jatrophihabitantaceae bacterium]
MAGVRRGAASEWTVDDVGEGDTVVLVHGLGTDSGAWDRVAPMLAERHRVLTVDLPGYSLRSVVDSVPHAGDLAAGLDAVLGRLGVPSAVFIGHSFGGAVSLLTAHHFPARCAGLALIAPGGFGVELNPVVPLMGTRAGARMLRALYWPRASRTIERIAARVEARSGVDGQVRIAELMETYGRLRSEQARDQFRSSVRESLALSAGIDRTQIVINSRIPILVLWGREDRVLPPWQAKNVATMLPWSTIRMLDGVGHTPHRSDPDSVAREIDAFIDGGEIRRRRDALVPPDS